MDFWFAVTIFAGSLGAIGIISFFIPGISQYVTAAINILWNGLRSTVEFVLNTLPKPFKILLFIALFSSIGLVAYNFTYGAQFVCDQGEVKEVSWVNGLAFKMTQPDDFTEKYWLSKEAGGSGFEESAVPYNAIDIVSTAGSEIITDEGYFTEGNLTYRVVGHLMPFSEIRSKGMVYDLNVLIQQIKNGVQYEDFVDNQRNDWGKFLYGWFGDEYQIKYNICHDPITDTCILKRASQFEVGYGCKSLSDTLIAPNPWLEENGNIWYGAEDGVITAKFDWISGKDTECREITSLQLDEVFESENVNSDLRSLYESIILYGGPDGLPTTINVVDDGLFGWQWLYGGEHTLTLYDVSRHFVARDFVTNNVVTDRIYTLGEDGSVRNTRTCDGSERNCDRYMLLENATVVKSSPGDISQVVCNEDTRDPEDTTLLLFGVHILDPATMAMFVIIGAIFSAIIWLKQLIG